MSYRVIQLHSRLSRAALHRRLENCPQVIDRWLIHETSEDCWESVLVRTPDVQAVTDHLQNICSREELPRMLVTGVEAVLPKPSEPEPSESNGHGNGKNRKKKLFAGISRDELYEEVSRGAAVNRTFALLVVFSTIVAAIGLLEDNVAVVIGAMVIAPLLGPNMALALATALGDRELMTRAIKTNVFGVSVALALSYGIGSFWPSPLDSPELLARTDVGLDGVVLALVSGAAAVLSLTSGVSSVLVGVMVAVALLPPATALGIMAGAARYPEAMGAGLLLAVNVVCVNLSAKLVFLLKGVTPRTWYEKKKARRAMLYYGAFWAASLLALMGIIALRSWWGGGT